MADDMLLCVQDPTNHPEYTGKVVKEVKEEGQAARYLKRFRGVGLDRTLFNADDTPSSSSNQ